MNQEQLILIYKYMEKAGWLYCFSNTDIGIGMKLIDGCYTPNTLDSNACWECVQEMEKRGHSDEFDCVLTGNWLNKEGYECFTVFSMNPTNFWNCFASWLEEREDRCEVNSYLSCVCSKGTKCCDKIHKESKS